MSDNVLPVLVLVKDLLFATKISATAQARGVSIKSLRDPAKLSAEPGHRLIIDLNQDGALEAAAAWRAEGAARQVLAFVSHVDGELIKQARAQGIDRVLARSHFVQTLDELLTDWPGR